MPLLYGLLTLVALFFLFVVWRIGSVSRGVRKRDAEIFRRLVPLAQRFKDRQRVTPDEVLDAARHPELRASLYAMLQEFQRLDLFPHEYLSQTAQAETALVTWLMHPNELQNAPGEIELIEVLTREREGETAKFYVFRYRMEEGHWAEKDGWLLGLAAPFVDGTAPYSVCGAFSRCSDQFGKVQPSELVDWFIRLNTRG